MPTQSWVEVKAAATVDAAAYANSTTEAVIVPNLTIYASEMKAEKVVRITLFGKLSTTGTPTMVWAVRHNGATGTLLATTEAIAMGSGMANVNWMAQIYLQGRASGSSGSILGWGFLHVHTSATAVSENVFSVSGYDAPAAVTVDLATADWPLSITGDWSAASASNTITTLFHLVEYLN